MSMHPELNLRLAQAKIEEARSGARRAAAVRAASLDRQVSDVTAATYRKRWAATLATVTRARSRQRSVDATARTDNEGPNSPADRVTSPPGRWVREARS